MLADRLERRSLQQEKPTGQENATQEPTRNDGGWAPAEKPKSGQERLYPQCR
jgi:hypothetical protein